MPDQSPGGGGEGHAGLTEPLLLGFSNDDYFYLAGVSLVTASILLFPHRRYKIFMLFFLRNSSPLFFISRFSSFSVISVSVDKNLAEKRLEFVVYFILKVRVARVFALQTSSYNRVAIPVDWVILQWVRKFCLLRSGPVFFKQWNNLIIRKTFAYEKEDWQGYSRDRKREMCLWWMWWFHEVRWSDLWLLRLFFHSKNDYRSSSDSASRHQEDSTSDAGTSGRANQETWKDEDLGWFPNPKGEYSEFSKSILPEFYLSFWITCPYKERFRRCFVTERKHKFRKFARLWKQ